jgi:ketosteroid isomerase-like protein
MTPIEVIQSVYDAFRKGDIAQILSLVSPTATWRQSKSLPWGGDYTGNQGAAEFFRKLAAEMDTTLFEVKENIEAGNEVFSFGRYEGRSRHTGQTGGGDFMFRWRVRDGMIVCYESYIDTAAILAALPAKSSAAR